MTGLDTGRIRLGFSAHESSLAKETAINAELELKARGMTTGGEQRVIT